MRIDSTRIILTGAASGIGAALLAQLSAFPCAILAADLDTPRLVQTVEQLAGSPAAVAAFAGDMGSPDHVDALFDATFGVMGGVDIFIANAGFAYYERLERADWPRIEALLKVNVMSPIYATVKMEELNRERPHRTVIVASAMGRLAIPGYALYGGSKAALHRFAEGYRLELADPNSIALVYPIGTRTRFFDRADGPPAPQPWPTQSAEAVARAVVRGIERDAQKIYPSFLFRLTLALDRIFPPTRRIEQLIEGRRFRRWLARR